jgi:hypothetical protein
MRKVRVYKWGALFVSFYRGACKEMLLHEGQFPYGNKKRVCSVAVPFPWAKSRFQVAECVALFCFAGSQGEKQE